VRQVLRSCWLKTLVLVERAAPVACGLLRWLLGKLTDELSRAPRRVLGELLYFFVAGAAFQRLLGASCAARSACPRR